MIRLKPRELRLFWVIVIVSGTLFAYGRLFEPRFTRWKRLDVQIQNLEHDLRTIRDLLAHRKEIESNSSALQKQIAAQGTDDQELKSMLEELERIALEAQLVPVSMRPQKSRDFGFYQLMSAELVIEGDQRNLARFLYHIGDSAQLLRIDRLQVSALRSAEKIRAECLVIKILSFREPL